MTMYEQQALADLKVWQIKMQRHPSLFNALSKKLQTTINTWIPEKIHRAITTAMKQMIRTVLFGAELTATPVLTNASLENRETIILKKIETYRTMATVEGGLTGAGGLLLGLADFPLLLGIKIKLLFEIAALYGFDTNNYKERIYLLHIFELAFSSDSYRKKCYFKIADWKETSKHLPEDIHQFDWRNFQQEYRDYIDLAKMAQLIPVIGAPVGAIVNYKLIQQLGNMAMNAYRMRLLQ